MKFRENVAMLNNQVMVCSILMLLELVFTFYHFLYKIEEIRTHILCKLTFSSSEKAIRKELIICISRKQYTHTHNTTFF